jgi:hypothetical protein
VWVYKPNSVFPVVRERQLFLFATHPRVLRLCGEAGAGNPGPVIQESSPIWSCSMRGLPCPRYRYRGGGLLPHLFTLTPTQRVEAVSFLWHFPSPADMTTGFPDCSGLTALRSLDFPPSITEGNCPTHTSYNFTLSPASL